MSSSVPVASPVAFPLTSPQREIWFDQWLRPDVPLYNIGGYLDVAGPIDAGTFLQALRHLVQSHDAFRTVFGQDDQGLPVQFHAPELAFDVASHDFSDAPDPHAQAMAWMQHQFVQPFDVLRSPLFRHGLLKLGADRYYWFAVFHHLIADGWTIALQSQYLADICTALLANQAPPSDAPSYVDFILDDQAYLQSPARERQRQYWADKFAHPPEPLFPVPRHAGAGRNARSERSTLRIERDSYDRLVEFAERHGANAFHAILAALYVYVVRTTASSEFTVGLQILNRSNAAFKKTAGLFFGMSPARFDFGTGLDFAALMQEIGRELKRNYRHQRFSMSEINRDVAQRHGAARRLFDITVSYERHDHEVVFGDALGTAHPLHNEQAHLPLALSVQEFHRHEAVLIDFVYDTAYFNAEEIGQLQRRLVTILDFARQHGETRVDRLPLMDADERRQVLVDFNDTDVGYPDDGSIHHLFERQAALRPDATALVFGDHMLTYGALNASANRLAHHLRSLGIGPDGLVGVCLERSPDMVIALLAVLKAGGAYVPLDPDYPPDRLAYMLADARPAVLLTHRRLWPALPASDSTILNLDALADSLIERPATDPVALASPANLAYVIYTSGSTGRPKGVQIDHAGILNRLQWMQQAYALTSADRVLQKTPFSFDVSVWEFFWPLAYGATLVLAKPGGHQDAAYLSELIAAQAITTLHFVPPMLDTFLDVAGTRRHPHLRQVICSGQALPASLQQRFFAHCPGVALHNLYGPTEASVDVTHWTCRDDPMATSVPIGHPIANTRLHILDADLNPVPIGVTGELHIAGIGLARGYLDRPDLTAEKFIANPFAKAPGERLYKTGDLARYHSDGRIEYLGRNDSQVKLRGFRIELGEIDAALAACDGVRSAAVVLREDTPGDQRLVAYVTTLDDAEPSVADWRLQLSRTLADHLIPNAFVTLEAFPLTSNGKLDRQALPAPDLAAVDAQQYEAPAGAIEPVLAAIWRQVLQLDRVGRHDHFFLLGGHSLLATRLTGRIRDEWRIELPLRVVFEQPVLASMAEAIARTRAASGTSTDDGPTLAPVPRNGAPALSFAQQRLWFLDQFESGSAFYNLSGGLRMNGPLDVAALRAALDDLVQRHEVLRTGFDVVDSAAVQVIAAQAPPSFTLIDLAPVDASQREAEATRLATAEAALPFDLGRPPLLRALLLRLGEQEHWLLLTLHHIAADGWSMDILRRELAVLYRAHLRNEAPGLAPLPIQYADYAAWQRAWLQGAQWERQLDYWRGQLAGAPALLDLPTDHPRPAVQSYRGARVAFTLAKESSAQLHALGHRAGATLYMTLIGAFGVLLSRYSGQHDVCIGTPIAGRQRAELEGLVGMFVNTLAIRLRLDGNPAFDALLSQVRETTLAAYAHQDMPFEQLVEALRPERHMSHAPLFQAMFVLQNAGTSAAELAGLQVQPLAVDLPVAKFDLTLAMWEEGEQLHGSFEYSTDLFEHGTLERMAGNFQALLAALVLHPQTPVGLLPLLSTQEKELLLSTWNQTRLERPAAPAIHALFEAQAERFPEQVAVVFEDRRLTYRELNERANRLAHYLQEQGIGPDDLVGICVERSLEMIVAVFGVLKAGGAYLPLDPVLPPARMTYLLDDARPKFLLTQAHLLERLPDIGIGRLCLDEGAAQLAAWPVGNPRHRALSDNLAYVIYTSGSTGNPKGTLLYHGALVNLVVAQAEAFGLEPGLRVLQWASFNFDVSVSDIFTALCFGASLTLASREAVMPGGDLWHTLRRHRIELVALTASALAALPHDPLPDLKTFVVGGEQFDHALIAPWLKHHDVINAYGPTEATVCATVHRCSPDGLYHPPIGRPLANTQVHILDEHLNLVPIGVAGELYIAGEGLARGYLNRPDLTAERFISNPFSAEPGARMYKTGDLARYRWDGNIDCLGRLDHQVKIRGHRIELGEIESALDRLTLVREAAVLVQDTPAGDTCLVAYVASASGTLDADALRAALRRDLPEYMIPAHFVALDKLPINTNGKIDRTALDTLAWVDEARSHEAPATPTERTLAALWTALLACAQVGRGDNFFHLGGHSLLAVKLSAKIHAAFDVSLPVSQIFASPTLSELALAIDGASPQAGLLVSLRKGRGTPVFLVHPSGGTVFCYAKLARALEGGGPVHAIQSPEIAGLEIGPYDLETLCRRYVMEIAALHPSGPVRLAGWSMGGLLAMRMTALLEQQDREVDWVGVFDTYPLSSHAALTFADFLDSLLSQLRAGDSTADRAFNEAGLSLTRAVQTHGAEHVGLMIQDDPRWFANQGIDAAYIGFLRQQYAMTQRHAILMREFAPVSVHAPLHVVWAADSRAERGSRMDWLAWTRSPGRSTQCTLPGHHFDVILRDENVRAIAARLAVDQALAAR